MNLKDFVAKSLEEIILGVQEAQEAVKGTNAKIAPVLRHLGGMDGAGYWVVAEKQMGFQVVTFDVAVTVNESTGKKGEAGLRIPYFSMGGGLEASQENGTISRIKFEMPIVWPSLYKKKE